MVGISPGDGVGAGRVAAVRKPDSGNSAEVDETALTVGHNLFDSKPVSLSSVRILTALLQCGRCEDVIER
jgi:hypothetical protein